MGGLVADKPKNGERCHSQPLTTLSDDPASQVSSTDPYSHRKKSRDQDLEFQSEEDESRQKRRKLRRNHCCAWTSFFIGTAILILLFLGTILFAFFASNLPRFYLNSLTVNKLQLNRTGADIFMNSNILVTLNATNTRSQIQFLYSDLRADVYADDVFLGKVHLSGFHQNANNSTLLKLQTVVNQQPVADADASELKSDLESNSLSIDVDLKGVIEYEIQGHRIFGFPFRVSCKNKVQSSIYQNQQYCKVKMTPVA